MKSNKTIEQAAEEYSTEKHLSDIKHKIGTDYYESCKSLSRDMMENSETDFISGAEYAHQFEAKWVSVDELPKEAAEYNVCYKMPNGKWHVFTAGYSTSFKKWDFRNKDITHYEPLPSPPPEVQKGEESA